MNDVWRLYDRAAAQFAADRSRLAGEEVYLDEVLRRLGPGRRNILDVGCGTGSPVAGHLIDEGCDVTGVDAAPAMIAIARARYPGATWLVHDMRSMALGRRFDAVVAWDSFFHLTADDQRAVIPVFAEHVVAGGLLLFTSGPEAGIALGSLYGQELFHASLSAEEYRTLLAAHGFAVLLHRVEDPRCGGHTVWLAESRHPVPSAGGALG